MGGGSRRRRSNNSSSGNRQHKNHRRGFVGKADLFVDGGFLSDWQLHSTPSPSNRNPGKNAGSNKKSGAKSGNVDRPEASASRSRFGISSGSAIGYVYPSFNLQACYAGSKLYLYAYFIHFSNEKREVSFLFELRLKAFKKHGNLVGFHLIKIVTQSMLFDFSCYDLLGSFTDEALKEMKGPAFTSSRVLKISCSPGYIMHYSYQ